MLRSWDYYSTGIKLANFQRLWSDWKESYRKAVTEGDTFYQELAESNLKSLYPLLREANWNHIKARKG